MKKIVLFLAAFSLTACYHTTSPTTTDSQVLPPEQSQTDSMTGDEQITSDFTIEMNMFSFTPNTLTASPGETITVLLDNQEGVHDLVIDELSVASSQLQAGEQETIEITIPDDAIVGTQYEFYCSVGNHRAMGMLGTLTVN